MFKAKKVALAAFTAVALVGCGGGDGDADTVPPQLDVDIAQGAPIAGEAVTFIFTFNEDVVGFDAKDVQLQGGTRGAFTVVSARAYTLVVSLNEASEVLRVSVAPGAAQDTAGNTYAEGLIYETSVLTQPVERPAEPPAPHLP